MSRTAVAYSNLVANSSLADPAGTAVTSGAGNGAQIPATSGGGSLPEQTVLRVHNGSGGAGTVTLKAGTLPLAIAANVGDLVSGSIADAGNLWLGPFESGRFEQSDGSMILEASVAVTVTAFKVPRSA